MPLIIFILLISCTPVQVQYESGTFTGTGSGYHGPIIVDLVIENNKIKEIEVVRHEDHMELAPPVFEKLSKIMIQKNSAKVDAVAGATKSSKGFMEAVSLALEDGIKK